MMACYRVGTGSHQRTELLGSDEGPASRIRQTRHTLRSVARAAPRREFQEPDDGGPFTPHRLPIWCRSVAASSTNVALSALLRSLTSAGLFLSTAVGGLPVARASASRRAGLVWLRR
jgi:hypothetical protein